MDDRDRKKDEMKLEEIRESKSELRQNCLTRQVQGSNYTDEDAQAPRQTFKSTKPLVAPEKSQATSQIAESFFRTTTSPTAPRELHATHPTTSQGRNFRFEKGKGKWKRREETRKERNMDGWGVEGKFHAKIRQKEHAAFHDQSLKI